VAPGRRDVLGVAVHIPDVCESTSLGAAVLAAQAVGLEGGLAAGSAAAFARRVEPDPDAARTYDELYGGWRALYRAALELSEAGLVRPLWRAAGA